MEFLEGGNVKKLIEIGSSSLTEAHVAGIARELLSGINALHQRNIVHRDIKPSNIVVNINGDVKLSIFSSYL